MTYKDIHEYMYICVYNMFQVYEAFIMRPMFPPLTFYIQCDTIPHPEIEKSSHYTQDDYSACVLISGSSCNVRNLISAGKNYLSMFLTRGFRKI